MLINRLKKIILKIFLQIMFWLKFPYLIFVRSNSAFKIEIPRGISIGRGSKLWVTNPLKRDKHILIGRGVRIGDSVELQTWNESVIELGKYTTIQDRCKILGDVKIGEYVIFAPNAYVSSGTHYFDYSPQELIRTQDKLFLERGSWKKHSKKVRIDDDVWIGAQVFIGQGIHIGRGAVIGANSIITKNVMPYSVVVGANKELKKRLSWNPPKELNYENKKDRCYFYKGFNKDNTLNPKSSGVLILDADVTGIDIYTCMKEQRAKIECSRKIKVSINGEKVDVFNTNFEEYELLKDYLVVKVTALNEKLILEKINSI